VNGLWRAINTVADQSVDGLVIAYLVFWLVVIIGMAIVFQWKRWWVTDPPTQGEQLGCATEPELAEALRQIVLARHAVRAEYDKGPGAIREVAETRAGELDAVILRAEKLLQPREETERGQNTIESMA